ncbi:MAG: hypothetical protein ABS901_05575 [Candidatus Limivicinus sp.]
MKTTIRRLLLTTAACLLFGHVSAFAEGPITEVSQLNDPKMTIGVDQGSVVEIIVKNELPEAKKAYYTDKYTGYEAVRQGKIDAFAFERLQMSLPSRAG